MGFAAIRQAYQSIFAANSDESAKKSLVRMVSFELCDAITGELVSGEVGYICGCVYTCLSLFSSRKPKYERSDRVRTEAVILWLSQAGVGLFDVGCTADYYCALFNFKKTSRIEFLKLWRKFREETPKNLPLIFGSEGGLSKERIKEMLKAQELRFNTATAQPPSSTHDAAAPAPGFALVARVGAPAVAYLVMAYKVMAYTVMACAVMACTGTAYMVMAYIIMTCIVTTYIVTAYVVMVYVVVFVSRSLHALVRLALRLYRP